MPELHLTFPRTFNKMEKKRMYKYAALQTRRRAGVWQCRTGESAHFHALCVFNPEIAVNSLKGVQQHTLTVAGEGGWVGGWRGLCVWGGGVIMTRGTQGCNL